MLQDDGESLSWNLVHDWKAEQLLRAGGCTGSRCRATAGNGLWQPYPCKGVRHFIETMQGPRRGFECPELAHPFTCSAASRSSQRELHSLRPTISKARICSTAFLGSFSGSYLVSKHGRKTGSQNGSPTCVAMCLNFILGHHPLSDSVIAFLCPGSWSGWRPKC